MSDAQTSPLADTSPTVHPPCERCGKPPHDACDATTWGPDCACECPRTVTHDGAREAMRRGAPHDAAIYRYITEQAAREKRDASALAGAIDRAEKSERERDDARKILTDYFNAPDATLVGLATVARNLLRSRRPTQADMDRLTAERDEARAALATMTADRDGHATAAIEGAEIVQELQVERDALTLAMLRACDALDKRNPERAGGILRTALAAAADPLMPALRRADAALAVAAPPESPARPEPCEHCHYHIGHDLGCAAHPGRVGPVAGKDCADGDPCAGETSDGR